VAYCRADRFADAIATLETTIQLMPDYPRAHYYLGIAYDRAGRAGDGAAAFRRASELRAAGQGAAYRLD
jgi:Flp pilus assembly protein TadD